MNTSLNYENGIVNYGNRERIRSVMERAGKGERITIGFIGGSITMGSVSSTPEGCYAYRVFEWWQKSFPKAELLYVNAGIGATDSQFGCARVEKDLLSREPDFVVVEFSVNDSCTRHYMETYEGLIRRILKGKNSPALMLVHNVFYDTGASAQLVQARVARHYNLPAVSMQSSIYPELLAGRIENREITPDDLHPNDKGHELVASVVTFFLEKVKGELLGQGDKEIQETELPAPLTENAYEDSKLYQNGNSSPVLDGFLADTEKQEGITDLFKNGWKAVEKGARFALEVEGQCIAVQYRKTMKLPAPVAEVVVDQDREHPIRLDGNFDESWGDKMELVTVLEHGRAGRHTIEITLVETHHNDQLPFYLVSVIGS